MEKVNDAWPKYLVFISGVALLIYGFEERRARIYASVLIG
jgi:hypothetical protein